MVVAERKKREGERPTDRRMRPAAVFNWEGDGWDFVPLGAAPPSIVGRRNTITPRSLLALLHYRLYSFPALVLPFAAFCGL